MDINAEAEMTCCQPNANINGVAVAVALEVAARAGRGLASTATVAADSRTVKRDHNRSRLEEPIARHDGGFPLLIVGRFVLLFLNSSSNSDRFVSLLLSR